MKKLLTLCLALVCSAAIFAQADNTFRFVDKNGTVYPDGSVLNLTELEESDFGEWCVNSGLYLENTTSSTQNARVTVDVKSLSEGSSIKFCVMFNCSNYEAVGSYSKEGAEVAGNKDDLMLEWLTPYEEDEEGNWTALPGSASIELSAAVLNGDGSLRAMGPSITINFSYTDPAGVSGITADKDATVIARYNAAGQQIGAAQKGLNIVRLSNGKTIKQIIK